MCQRHARIVNYFSTSCLLKITCEDMVAGTGPEVNANDKQVHLKWACRVSTMNHDQLIKKVFGDALQNTLETSW